jgi:hypothetical protein
MDIFELTSYLKETEGYIEFSFYKNSSDIMGAISKNGIEEVLSIISITESKKGIYECVTTWEVNKDKYFNKNVIIDMSGEMIFITESLDTNDSNPIKDSSLTKVDIQRDYPEILSLLKSKPLNSIEKNILTKVVAAFYK